MNAASAGRLEQVVASLKEKQIPLPTFSLAEAEHGRGGGVTALTKITIPRGASFIRLRLDLLEDRYESYQVVLEDAQQQELRKVELRSAQGKAVVVRLPSGLLTNGQV